jgi:hypothetical protein
MTDKETVREMLIKARVSFIEERYAITIFSNYIDDFSSYIKPEEVSIHTLFEFNDDNSLRTCRGYRGEDY